MALKHEIQHGLELPLAKKAIDRAMDAYQERFSDYNPEYNWSSETSGVFSFKAKGVKVAGEIVIQGPLILVDIEVPLLLRVFKGKAIQVIDREVRAWVEKARNGELD